MVWAHRWGNRWRFKMQLALLKRKIMCWEGNGAAFTVESEYGRNGSCNGLFFSPKECQSFYPLKKSTWCLWVILGTPWPCASPKSSSRVWGCFWCFYDSLFVMFAQRRFTEYILKNILHPIPPFLTILLCFPTYWSFFLLAYIWLTLWYVNR